jgi:hypothetical protein
MHTLLTKAREAWLQFGFIPHAVEHELERWGVNVRTLERNWAEGRV